MFTVAAVCARTHMWRPDVNLRFWSSDDVCVCGGVCVRMHMCVEARGQMSSSSIFLPYVFFLTVFLYLSMCECMGHSMSVEVRK